jgi:acetyltransferase
MARNLDCIFKPKSIAVVGASTKKGTIGHVMLDNLIRNKYRGEIFPVNPKADDINGAKCFHAIAEIPRVAELAIILVPRDFVAQSIEECGRVGIRGVIAITAGFKEIGGEGIAKEKEVVDIIHKHGVRMVGPNCYGIINTQKDCSVNATFSKLNPIPGRVAFLSQSGALGEVVLDYTNRLNLGISMFISIGNKADISDIEVLEYWENDPGTDVILAYIENIENPSEFIRVARRITLHKPIVAVKAGRTESGARAISSHTGVLAGGDVGIDAFFDKCGIVRAISFEELFDIARALTSQPIPSGDRVAVLTNAGGPGILATDAIESLGLKMARFEPRTIEHLRANLLPMAAITNPIDVIASGGPEAYGAATQAALQDPSVDALMVIFVPPMMIDHKAVLNSVIEKIQQYQDGKTVLACIMGSPSGIAGTEDLIANNIPIYAFPDGAARALAGTAKYRRFLNEPDSKSPKYDIDQERVRRIIDASRAADRKFILGQDGMAILSAYGVKVPGSALAKTENELMAAISKLSPPFAIKADDPQIVHKTEVGGVMLNIVTADGAVAAFRAMRQKFTRADGSFMGVMIQEMFSGGVETIIGMNLDSAVGPLMMFGLGGVIVEIMKDVAFRVNPLSEREAKEMIESVKGYKLLSGFRGAQPVDFENLKDTILRLSQLAADFPEFESIDINPFIASPEKSRSVAVDARFVLRD